MAITLVERVTEKEYLRVHASMHNILSKNSILFADHVVRFLRTAHGYISSLGNRRKEEAVDAMEMAVLAVTNNNYIYKHVVREAGKMGSAREAFEFPRRGQKSDKKTFLGVLDKVIDKLSAEFGLQEDTDMIELVNEGGLARYRDNEGLFDGESVVFTGFRNPGWARTIEAEGGEVGSSVSRRTTLLVWKPKRGGGGMSGKHVKAEQYGARIMTLDEFQDFMYKNDLL